MNKRSYRGYALAALLSAVAVTILRIFVSLFYTEAYTGVYVRDALLPTVLTVSSALLIAVFSVIGYFIQKKRPFTYKSSGTRIDVIASAFVGFMCFAVSAFLILDMMLKKSYTIALIVIAVSGILSGFYYVAGIFAGERRRGVFALLAIFPMLLNVSLLVELYFDSTILISCPNRYYNQLAYVAVMFFLLAEMRNAVGGNAKIYIPSAAVAGSLLAVSSIPNLAVYLLSGSLFPKLMPAQGATDRPIIYALELAFAIYAFMRLFTLCRADRGNAEYEEDPTEFIKNN